MIRAVPSAFRVIAAMLALAAALPVQARNVSTLRPVAGALATEQARQAAGELPLLFGSASAAGADLVAAEVEVNGEASIVIDARSRVHLTDAEACQKAFEDAIGKLAGEARRVGAAAAVGIVSHFRGQLVDDAQSYDCHSGSSASYVTLKASLARSYAAPGSRALPPATGFAVLDDIHAVPISLAGQDSYAHFLTLPKPRAFVVYEDGNWRFFSKDPEAMTKALDFCAREGKRCWLYAADDRVVWDADVGKRIGASAQLAGAARPANAGGGQ